VLCISSQVVYGPVGNSAAVPALESAGVTVLALPTTILSNHPGHTTPAGIDIPARTISEMCTVLHNEGWLNDLDCILTGYFRDHAQVSTVAEIIATLKQHNAKLSCFCDPILGDDHTGLYVPVPVAKAIRDQLLPLADIISPNRFEFEWLTGRPITGTADATAAAGTLAVPTIIVSSLPAGAGKIATAVMASEGSGKVTTRQRPAAPHGVGDLLSGLFLGELLKGNGALAALGNSMAVLEHVLDAGGDSDALLLPAGLAGADKLAPLPVETINDD
ncbi:MAG: pyridoxal kinase, partial [Aestuariivirgaceae bacterium]